MIGKIDCPFNSLLRYFVPHFWTFFQESIFLPWIFHEGITIFPFVKVFLLCFMLLFNLALVCLAMLTFGFAALVRKTLKSNKSSKYIFELRILSFKKSSEFYIDATVIFKIRVRLSSFDFSHGVEIEEFSVKLILGIGSFIICHFDNFGRSECFVL